MVVSSSGNRHLNVLVQKDYHVWMLVVSVGGDPPTFMCGELFVLKGFRHWSPPPLVTNIQAWWLFCTKSIQVLAPTIAGYENQGVVTFCTKNIQAWVSTSANNLTTSNQQFRCGLSFFALKPFRCGSTPLLVNNIQAWWPF